MDRVKGIEVLFDALTGSGIRFKLTIVGDREYLVTPKELRGSVTYTEKLTPDEYLKLLESCDLYICLSLLESFSISSLEAMAMGCAVIVSENAGISEYITDGVNGFVVSVEQPNLIRELLLRLNVRRELIRTVGCEAAKIRENVNWGIAIAGYLRDYERLLHG